MRTLPILVLPLFLGCGIDRDDGNIDEPATSDQEQALNGDEWSTVYDDNATPTGFGAEYTGIAISPTTHTAVIVGGHSGAWFVMRKTVLNSWTDDVLKTNRDPFDLGHGGIPNAVAVSGDGIFYSAGSSLDAANKRHVIIRRSLDDGTSWTTLLDSSVHGEAEARSITVDVHGNVYAAGYTRDSVVPSTHGVVWTVPTSGSSTEANVIDGIGTEFVALNGICTDHAGTTIYTTGNKVLPAPPGFPLPSITSARFSTNGSTWTTAFEHQFRSQSAGTGCGAGTSGDVWFSGYSIDSTASSYQVIHYTPGSGWVEASWFSASQLNRAQAILHLDSRTYVVGTTWNDPNGNWRTRFRKDNETSWTDSDTVHKTGAINIAVANAAAYQPAAGVLPAIFLVVGVAPDSADHAHGIVRQRTAF